ncbi:MAG: amidohydrolase [Gemmatimonadetes bacterium]|nr:amidohydrolase [Gemmatimonadota bacterium]
MHVNVHAHVFTLRTVLSREAIRVITQRLEDRGLPPLVVRAVERLLDRLLDRPENLDERQILARLLAELREVAGFDRFVEENLARLPFATVIRGEGIERLQVDTLRAALDQLTTVMGGGGEVGKRPFDIVQTLRLALRSTITEVADELLDQMDPDDALVALMMDIHAPDEPARDRDNFLRQVAGTREAALQRPGRVLPFFAVHPERSDHFALMTGAIDEGGFLGVKLYPSLGYEVDGPELLRVYEYCIEKDVPVLLHCGHGGFYRRPEYIDYCDPARWEPVLTGDLEGLRVCFAHFGGWQSLGRPDGLDDGTWGATILRFMRERPNVYTDLAYHSDQMLDPADETHYFARLAELLRDEHLRRRILFGTDSWLLRLDMTDDVYWRYFRQHMAPADFDHIAGAAPKLFLGFPEAPGAAMRANLQRHVAWLSRHRAEVGARPPTWLLEAAGEAFEAGREPADWSQKSRSVRCTYRQCRAFMTPGQVRGGYLANRTTRLAELTYFRPQDPNFALVVDGLALNLVGCAEDTGAPYRESWTRAAAVERVMAVLRTGDSRLVDVAGLLDSMFDFEEALV